MQKIKVFLQTRVGKITLAVLLIGVGFLGGMEYKAYQVRSAIRDAFGGFNTEVDKTSSKKDELPASNDLNKKVNLTVEKKSFASQSFQDANMFTFKFTNNSGKDIEGVQGTINFMDLFGNSIKQVQLSYDEGIKAGESKLYTASVDYNQFMEDDIKLRGTDLSKLKYEWDVDTIVYIDGTKETK